MVWIWSFYLCIYGFVRPKDDDNVGTAALVGPILDDQNEEDYEPGQVRSSLDISLDTSLYSINSLWFFVH
jgi:hypothetical protein